MSARSRWRGNQRGYTLVELLVVMLVIATIAGIALPNLVRARMRARAAAIVADFTAIRSAAVQYYTDTNAWPADTGPGIEPAELAPFLHKGLNWSAGTYDYEWENWMAPDGGAVHPGTGVLVGVSVRSTDTELLDAIEQEWGAPLGRRADGVTFAVVPIGR